MTIFSDLEPDKPYGAEAMVAPPICSCRRQIVRFGFETCERCYQDGETKRKEAERLRRAKYPRTPEQVRRDIARSHLHTYIKRGKALKRPCEICGNAKSHPYHADYAKPLEVRWRCHSHRNDSPSARDLI